MVTAIHINKMLVSITIAIYEKAEKDNLSKYLDLSHEVVAMLTRQSLRPDSCFCDRFDSDESSNTSKGG